MRSDLSWHRPFPSRPLAPWWRGRAATVVAWLIVYSAASACVALPVIAALETWP